jgi:hypothetical protein
VDAHHQQPGLGLPADVGPASLRRLWRERPGIDGRQHLSGTHAGGEQHHHRLDDRHQPGRRRLGDHGNLIADTRATTDWRYGSAAISANQLGSGHRIEFNTIVKLGHRLRPRVGQHADALQRRDQRPRLDGIRPLGANHVMSYNYLYNGATTDFLGSTNVKYTSASASRDNEYCFWRKRWSVPERICIPYGSTLAASPHVKSLAVCDPAELLSPFGLEPAAWVTSQPCADGVDNDGDGRVDSSTDIGCGSSTLAPTESPECQNGLDDDGDGRIDFDGGRAANGGSALGQPDPECKAAYQRSESSGCGLGFEVGVALTLLAWRRRQIR